MNCALAFSQMSRYRKIINQRNKIAEFYKKEIKKNKDANSFFGLLYLYNCFPKVLFI